MFPLDSVHNLRGHRFGDQMKLKFNFLYSIKFRRPMVLSRRCRFFRLHGRMSSTHVKIYIREKTDRVKVIGSLSENIHDAEQSMIPIIQNKSLNRVCIASPGFSFVYQECWEQRRPKAWGKAMRQHGNRAARR